MTELRMKKLEALQKEKTRLNTIQVDLKNKINEWETERQKVLQDIRRIDNELFHQQQMKLI